MERYSSQRRSPFFDVLGGLNRENLSDHKVGMLTEVDLSSAQRLRAKAERLTGVRPSYTTLVIKAIALALREHPSANRVLVGPWFWRALVQLKAVDVTVMVERDWPGHEQAAFADTIRDCDTKDLATITKELRDLANATPETSPRWRQFKWIVEKLPSRLAVWVLSLPRWSAKLWVAHRGGAVMISSPARYGVDVMVGTWPWPLGVSFGFVKERAVVVEGQVVPRPTMTVTLSFDRRLMAGAPAARFFHTFCELLQNAEQQLADPAQPVRSPDPACQAR